MSHPKPGQPSTATIEQLDEEQITLNLNGQIHEIRHQLQDLQELLQSQQVQTIQYADKIYNIEHINEANFGFVTGTKAFNQDLTKTILEAIQEDCLPAQKFLSRVQKIKDWEKETRISNKAKEIIAYSFVGVIGIQLSKLMAIGKEDYTETKPAKYVRKCATIVKRSLDLVNYAFLSRLWDVQKKSALPLKDNEKDLLSQVFDRHFEQSTAEQFDLLEVLDGIFSEHKLKQAFPEFNLGEQATALRQICTAYGELDQILEKGEVSLLDCAEAETKLAQFFQIFHFLVKYNMASIKRIGYKQMRHVDPRYLHRFAALGIDSKANVDAEKVIYTPKTVHTDAVLLYVGEDYQDNINLFPLVIDYNALTFEHGVKICFYQGKNIADGSLEYRFLEDESTIHIEAKGLLEGEVDYNKLMLTEENQKQLNLEQVVAALEEARMTVLQDDDVYLDDL